MSQVRCYDALGRLLTSFTVKTEEVTPLIQNLRDRHTNCQTAVVRVVYDNEPPVALD